MIENINRADVTDLYKLSSEISNYEDEIENARSSQISLIKNMINTNQITKEDAETYLKQSKYKNCNIDNIIDENTNNI